jgi:hypothetical protein
VTEEEERAAAYLESCARRKAYESANARRLKGSEAARVGAEKAWDALRTEPRREPRRLAEARRQADRVGCDDAADESP